MQSETEKIKKVIGHRKKTSTEEQVEEKEEEEFTILKVINHMSCGTNAFLPDLPQKKKNLIGQGKMSRQEKLYQDILAGPIEWQPGSPPCMPQEQNSQSTGADVGRKRAPPTHESRPR